MTRKSWWGLIGCVLFAWGHARAADLTAQAGTTQNPPQLPPPAAPANQQPAAPEANANTNNDALSQAPSDTGEAPSGANPHMMGDFPGFCVPRIVAVEALRKISFTRNVPQTTLVNVPSFNVTNQILTIPQFTSNGGGKNVTIKIPVLTPTTIQVPVTTNTLVRFHKQTPVKVLATVCAPVDTGGAFKIAENEGQAPDDRVFFTYNYYSSVRGLSGNSSVPHTETVAGTFEGNPAIITTQIPAVSPPRIDVHREAVGFEKTFLGGDASIGLRAPVVEQVGEDTVGSGDFGDVTLIFKYAFLHDRRSGDTLSAGLALTAPTGPGLPTPDGDIHATLLQPFFGYFWSMNRWYIDGFTSLAVPTDERDVTLLFNDVGIGYRLYQAPQAGFVNAVTPTLEAHVTTPLNNRSENAVVRVPDLVVLTAGSHFDLFRQARLTLGVATPVTGPVVFDVEAIVQLNVRF